VAQSVAGVLTAMQEYAQTKIDKGEPVPEMITMPPTRIRP
jgi:hypothetical protein